MVDHTDDWMNPSRSVSFNMPAPEKGKIEYLIERARSIPVTGNVSSITQWDFWAKFDTVDERDSALKKLHDEHPAWHLRARNRNPWNEAHGIFPPASRPGINK